MDVENSNNINNISLNTVCYVVKQFIMLNNKAHNLVVDLLLETYLTG